MRQEAAAVKEYTDAEKIAGFDYFMEKRQRTQAAFNGVLEKYRDLQLEGAQIAAADALQDMQQLYNSLYIVK